MSLVPVPPIAEFTADLLSVFVFEDRARAGCRRGA